MFFYIYAECAEMIKLLLFASFTLSEILSEKFSVILSGLFCSIVCKFVAVGEEQI